MTTKCNCGGAYTDKTKEKHLLTKIHCSYALILENENLKTQLNEFLNRNKEKNKKKKLRKGRNVLLNTPTVDETLLIQTIDTDEYDSDKSNYDTSLNIKFTRGFKINYFKDMFFIRDALELMKNNDLFMNEAFHYDNKITIFKGFHLDSSGSRNYRHFNGYFGDSRKQSQNYHFYIDDDYKINLITKVQSCFL